MTSTPSTPTDFTHRHDDWMAEALALAQQAIALSEPNPRVGCLIVAADGQVIGRGHTQHRQKGKEQDQPQDQDVDDDLDFCAAGHGRPPEGW